MHTKAIQVIALEESAGTTSYAVSSHIKVPKNAAPSRTPTPPKERSVARTNMTQPMIRTTPAK